VNIIINSVDHAPDDLYGQTPIRARLVRMLAGSDRRGRHYWLAELETPISWTKDGAERAINHLVVAARWEGTSIQPGATLPVNIAYVTNDSVLSSEVLDLGHTEYVAIGMAKISGWSPSVWRHPWSAALLLATMATPAGVVLAWLAPRPLDAVVALPLVLMDVWATSRGVTGARGDEAPAIRVLLLLLGIVLTWLFYVLVARLVFWRLSLDANDGRGRRLQD
jgi:hypothetical protein